jgi:Ca2+-binding EF-hand superfamily protein
MRTVFIAALSLFAALAASAQDGPGPQPFGQDGGRGGRGRPIPNAGFTALDANNDGVLDATEIDAAPGALAKLDKNADGQISADEARAAMPAGRGRGGPGGPGGRGGRSGEEGAPQVDIVDETVKTLMAFDDNGDGKISRAELPERFQGIFDRGDENKDGFLTPDEIRKVAAAQAAPPSDAGPAGREGRGQGGRGEGGRGDMNLIRIDPILAAVDSNGDGAISADELRNAPASIRKLDKNGDGKITREEAIASAPPGR